MPEHKNARESHHGAAESIRCGGRRINGVKNVAASNDPIMTVITVVFNGVETVGDTIRSVAKQTYSNVEYIIIDGGSTDGTLDIIRAHEDSIDYWLSERDDGIYDAMNKGIELARGDYIGMLNADDFFSSPTVLETIAKRIKQTNVDAVFSYLDIVDPSNLDRVQRKYRVSRFSSFMLRIGVMPPHPTFYCKRSCYEKAGPYNTSYRIAADFEMLVRMHTKGKITWQVIKEVTVKMRSGGISARGIRSNWVVNMEILRACAENGLYTNILLLMLKIPVRLLEKVL